MNTYLKLAIVMLVPRPPPDVYTLEEVAAAIRGKLGKDFKEVAVVPNKIDRELVKLVKVHARRRRRRRQW